MRLTENNFCPFVENSSTPLKIMYTCKKTGKLCQKIEYSINGVTPKQSFIKNGCILNKKEEVKAVKKKESIKKETTPVQEIKKEQPVVKKTTTQRKKKTNRK